MLKPEKTGLLIIDIQNDYFEGEKNPLVNSLEATLNTKQLLKFFRKKKLPVFFVQHISTKKDADFFLPDSEGSKIHKLISPLRSEPVIIKHYPNSFHRTNLLEKIDARDLENLVICGMMTHLCIDSTVRAAKDFGFNCFLLNDAVATKELEFNGNHIDAQRVNETFMAALDGIYANIISTKDILELLNANYQ